MMSLDIQYDDNVTISDEDALIVVDMQYDFMPGGALAVEEGDVFINEVNSLMDGFFKKEYTVVCTQDWHPKNHSSFASAHEGKKPFDPVDAPGIGPVLWPDHCVIGSHGASLHEDLHVDSTHLIIRKGYNPEIDSYSGFLENDHATETGLDGYLKTRGVKRIFVCGLALDFCVFFTSLDGSKKGYDVYLLPDLSRGVGSPPESIPDAIDTMKKNGVKFIKPSSLKW